MKVDFKFVPSLELEKDKIQNNSIFFMHIPKCGGTTIDHVFAKLSLILNNVKYHRYKYKKLEDKKKLLISNLDSKKINFISGHLDFNFTGNIKNLYKCTIVRDPTNRVISHYKFMIHKLKQTPENYSFETFLENEINNYRDNIITRHFTGLLDEKKKITNNEKLIAIQNIKYFDNIQLLDNWDNFLSQILTLFGLPSILYSRFQQHEYDFSYELTKKDSDLIHKYYKYDYEVYSKILSSKNVKSINKNHNYNKNICIVSPFLKTDDKLYNELEVKKLFKINEEINTPSHTN